MNTQDLLNKIAEEEAKNKKTREKKQKKEISKTRCIYRPPK